MVGGICGTRKRIYKALMINQDTFYERLQYALTHPKKTVKVSDGHVKEVVEKPRLDDLPILTHYERDAGPYITSAVIYAQVLEEGIENVSIHRTCSIPMLEGITVSIQ